MRIRPPVRAGPAADALIAAALAGVAVLLGQEAADSAHLRAGRGRRGRRIGMTRVLVVDDQFLIRAGLVGLLRAAPGIEVVGEAGDGEEAIALAARTRPDVILMDIRMPGMSGVAATERILAEAPDPPPRVLVLTTFDLDEYVYGALRAGACASAGETRSSHPASRAAWSRRSPNGPRTPDEPPPDLGALTAREVEVPRLTARGLSNLEIAGELFISEATVETHLNRTMTKLDLGSRAQAVVVAYETGSVTPGGAR